MSGGACMCGCIRKDNNVHVDDYVLDGEGYRIYLDDVVAFYDDNSHLMYKVSNIISKECIAIRKLGEEEVMAYVSPSKIYLVYD